MDGKVDVSLLGTHFTLSSDQKSNYLEKVIQEYSLLVERVQHEMNLSDPLKSAIIAGIIATDERLKELRQGGQKNPLPDEEARAINRVAGQLIEKLNHCLDDDM